MMQLNSLRNDATAEYDDVSSTNSGLRLSESTTGLYPDISSGISTGGVPYLREHGFGSVINWGSDFQSPAGRSASSLGQGRVSDQPGLNNGLDQCGQTPAPDQSGQGHSSDDEEYRPFTPPPPRERLSYTRYQLALLNGIYQEVRYPNGTQKQLIAKRVGITREQVKIWFQNRRRKDVVTKVGGSKSESKESKNPQVVVSDGSTCSSTRTSQDTHVIKENTIEPCQEQQREVTLNTNSGEEESIDKCRANIYETNDDSEISEGRSCPTNPHIDGLSSASSTHSLSPAAVSSQVLSPLSSVPSPQVVSPTSMATSQLVSPVVLRSMIMELNKFDNNYLKQKKNKKKRSKSKSAKAAPAPPLPSNPKLLSSLPSFSSLSSCQTPRLFQNYDMIAPPNKLTPSANRTLHASETSAFRNPRGNKVFITSNENPTWAGPVVTTPNSAHLPFSSDFMRQSFPSDGLHVEGNTSSSQTNLTNYLKNSAAATLSHASHQTQASMYNLLSDHLSFSATQKPICTSSPASRQPDHSHLTSGPLDVDCRVEGANGADEHRSLRNVGSYPYHASLAHHPFSFHPSSHFPHVLPFPLIAEPPMVLANIGQDVQRQNWNYSTPHLNPHYQAHPPSSSQLPQNSQTSNTSTHPPQTSHSQNSAAQTSSLPLYPGSQSSVSALPHHLSSQAQSSASSLSALPPEAYRPLMISSLSNPYFNPTSLPYTPGQSAPPPTNLWAPGSDLNTNGFTGM